MARRLLPSSITPPSTALSAPDGAASNRKRKRPNGILAVACLACQKRKTKCDGGRPRCLTCSSKDSPCIYDAPEGQTRIAALKSRNTELQERLSGSVNLLWTLKTLPPDEAAAFLDRIRSAEDPSTFLNYEPPKGKQPRSPDSGVPSDPSSERSTETPPAKRANTIQTPSTMEVNPGDPWYPQSTPASPQDYSPFSIIKSPACRDAFQYFIKCTGTLFHIFTADQGNAALDDVLRYEDGAFPKISLCEVCAISAIGAQYSRGKISAKAGEHFYNLAKHFLDDVIECDPLRGMKICTLLAMYNVIIKGTVALAFIEMGIGLGSSKGISETQPSSQMGAEVWSDYKRVWRTLLCIKGWLVATLGYSDRKDWMEQILASRDVLPGTEISLQESVQMEMARLAIIKAKIFQTTFVFSELSTDAIGSVRADLQTWYEELRPCMQLAQLPNPAVDDCCRRGIYLVHCLHLGAMILVQRRIFQQYILDEAKHPELAQTIIRDLSDSIEEGFTASVTSARVLDLIFAESGIFQRCWLCIFQSYISTVEILFMTTQKLLHGYPSQQCLPDLLVGGRSLAVLKYCATEDHLAKDFVASVEHHYDHLLSLTSDTDSSIQQLYSFSPPASTPVPRSALPWEALLKLPPGDSDLHRTSRSLMAQLCSPFTNIRRIATKSEPADGVFCSDTIPLPLTSAEEITLGGHLDWSHEAGITSPDRVSDTVEREILASVSNGFFVNSSEPYGWTSVGCSDGSRGERVLSQG